MKKEVGCKTKCRELATFCFERCDTYIRSFHPFSKVALSVFSEPHARQRTTQTRGLPGWSLQCNELTRTQRKYTNRLMMFKGTMGNARFFLTLV